MQFLKSGQSIGIDLTAMYNLSVFQIEFKSENMLAPSYAVFVTISNMFSQVDLNQIWQESSTGSYFLSVQHLFIL